MTALQLSFWPEAPAARSAKAELRPWRPNLRAVRRDDLPPAYREVADLVGAPAAVALLRWRGGTTLSVPTQPRETHPLAIVLGLPTARLLASRYGGDRITLPALSAASAPQRNRALRAEYDAGRSKTAQLAWRFGLSERHIWRILNGEP